MGGGKASELRQKYEIPYWHINQKQNGDKWIKKNGSLYQLVNNINK